MLLTFEGRNSASKNSHPTCKDALVHLNRMPPRKVVRVTAKSMLVLHERETRSCPRLESLRFVRRWLKIYRCRKPR